MITSATYKHDLASEHVSPGFTPHSLGDRVSVKSQLRQKPRSKDNAFGRIATASVRKAPGEILNMQEERGVKMQIQNYKVYEELRKNMEQSIMRQRKALKDSIMKFVPKGGELAPRRKTRAAKNMIFSERKVGGTEYLVQPNTQYS